MKGFNIFGVGNVATDLELVKKGDTVFVKVPLIANDYLGRDKDGERREMKTQLYFVAFGAIAEALANSVRKGDQLIVQATVQANNWTDGSGEKRYDYSFVIDGFRFGAPGKEKRAELSRSAA